MRVVLDTNIWISGILKPSSSAGKVLSAWRHAQLSVITSQEILNEIQRVLNYPKIQKIIRWDKNKIGTFVNSIRFLSEFIILDESKIKVPRDSNDEHLMTALVTSKADYLITGDQDLLDLRMDYPIVTLHEFVEMVF